MGINLMVGCLEVRCRVLFPVSVDMRYDMMGYIVSCID